MKDISFHQGFMMAQVGAHTPPQPLRIDMFLQYCDAHKSNTAFDDHTDHN